MTDLTQGADAPDDSALFNDATSTTLEKFESPEPPKVEPPKPDPAEKPEPKPGDPPKPDQREDGPVPSGRFREESEARRRAERERDDLRIRLDAVSRPPPQQQQPPQKVDLFENPQGFVQQELKPFLEQIQADLRTQREGMSLDWAIRSHGDEKVGSARQALEQGMSRGDQNAWATYNRAMQSHDPYGVIVRWHNDGEVLRSTGGDLNAYRSRILDEALKDPEYQKRVFEAAKGQATAAGHSVARPVKSSVASSPSLGDIGAGGTDQQITEPSDDQLFRAAVTAKRR